MIQFIAFGIFCLFGFIIGGLTGETFSPSCWWGLLIGAIVFIAIRFGGADDLVD